MPGSDEMRPASSGVRLTYDDVRLLPEDGLRHELIDGEHSVSGSPSLRHQSIVGNLFVLIKGYLQTHRVGRAYVAPLDVVLSKYDVVVPDLIYASNTQFASIATDANLQGAPELIVAVGSKSTRRR